MPRAIDLLKQGRNEELWQMCCGYLKLDIDGFMDIQEHLLLKQLELLTNCPLGKKIMHGAQPRTLEEFRRQAPLTTYKDYCPELLEKREETLPEKPMLWAHTAGKTGEYPCKWAPMTAAYAEELSKILYGVGTISGCKDWGDISNLPETVKSLYSVAPAPYISGIFAELLKLQSPFEYLPPIDKVESLTFEERIQIGLRQAMSKGFDYFFGLSIILVNVGEKISQSPNKMDLRPFLNSPRALWRLGRGKIRSQLAGRHILPKDIWKIRGIIGSGVDSIVYKNKIKELWGKQPLDLYACTEGGVIATQTWDYDGMTFIPNLNLLEFIPEDEQLKWQMDQSYKPKTLLISEVEAGENYELVLTNFHGGALIRYRVGDMIKIQSLRNEKLGINIPQMVFERRVDDFIDFYVVTFTEKSIWQAIESAGVDYVDWIAYKDAANSTLNIGIELKDGHQVDKKQIASSIYNKLSQPDNNKSPEVTRANDLTDINDFGIEVVLLPKGTFASYIAKRHAEGADLAHLKPPHVNPPEKVLAVLTADTKETIIVTKSGTRFKEKIDTQEATIV
jgi:hypothetical protein